MQARDPGCPWVEVGVGWGDESKVCSLLLESCVQPARGAHVECKVPEKKVGPGVTATHSCGRGEMRQSVGGVTESSTGQVSRPEAAVERPRWRIPPVGRFCPGLSVEIRGGGVNQSLCEGGRRTRRGVAAPGPNLWFLVTVLETMSSGQVGTHTGQVKAGRKG